LIYDKLNKIKKENLISFHVPGHKYHDTFRKHFEDLLKYDVTEFPGTDDLHDPTEAILESQKMASSLYGSKASFYLVNGTTSGIYSMITATLFPGDTAIVARDCHRSVFDGLFLGRVNAEFVAPMMHEYGFPLGVTLESIIESHVKKPDAKAIILTYPNYYGVCCDLKGIVEYAHQNDLLVLVDGAHSAHFLLSDDLPICPVKLGADIVVQSSHKTLPVMTQASMLHVNSESVVLPLLKKMVKLYQTSSPSYILMSSLDIGMKILREEGQLRMKNLIKCIKLVKKECPAFLDYDDLGEQFTLDVSKLTLLGKKANIDPMDYESQLRNNHIQIEFSNENNAVLVTSIMNEKQDFQYLVKTMEMLEFKCYSGIDNNFELPKISNILPIHEAHYRNGKYMNLKESVGRISKQFVIPYPPGVPILIPGDEINQSTVDVIESMLIKGVNVLGYKNTNLDLVQIEVLS
jgi:arginine/lysine/ornithine decarboxylase